MPTVYSFSSSSMGSILFNPNELISQLKRFAFGPSSSNGKPEKEREKQDGSAASSSFSTLFTRYRFVPALSMFSLSFWVFFFVFKVCGLEQNPVAAIAFIVFILWIAVTITIGINAYDGNSNAKEEKEQHERRRRKAALLADEPSFTPNFYDGVASIFNSHDRIYVNVVDAKNTLLRSRISSTTRFDYEAQRTPSVESLDWEDEKSYVSVVSTPERTYFHLPASQDYGRSTNDACSLRFASVKEDLERTYYSFTGAASSRAAMTLESSASPRASVGAMPQDVVFVAKDERVYVHLPGAPSPTTPMASSEVASINMTNDRAYYSFAPAAGKQQYLNADRIYYPLPPSCDSAQSMGHNIGRLYMDADRAYISVE